MACAVVEDVTTDVITTAENALAKNTVVNLLCDLGAVYSEYMDRVMRDLPCQRVQLLGCVGLGKVLCADGAGGLAAFRRILYEEDQL